MRIRERYPTFRERVSPQGVAKGKLPAVTEQGLKSSPPSGGTLLTLPVSRSVEDQNGKYLNSIGDGRFERPAPPHAYTVNGLVHSASRIRITYLPTSACILWSEFLNGPFQRQQFSPRWRLSLSNQGLRETCRYLSGVASVLHARPAGQVSYTRGGP